MSMPSARPGALGEAEIEDLGMPAGGDENFAGLISR